MSPKFPQCPDVPVPTHGGHREADEHHGGVVEHHEEVLAQVGASGRPQGRGRCHLVSLHPSPVPVTQEHGVDVVDEVGDSELGVRPRQPVPGGGGHGDIRGARWPGNPVSPPRGTQVARGPWGPQFGGHRCLGTLGGPQLGGPRSLGDFEGPQFGGHRCPGPPCHPLEGIRVFGGTVGDPKLGDTGIWDPSVTSSGGGDRSPDVRVTP